MLVILFKTFVLIITGNIHFRLIFQHNSIFRDTIDIADIYKLGSVYLHKLLLDAAVLQ